MPWPRCHFSRRCATLGNSLTSAELWALQNQGLNHLQRAGAAHETTSPAARLLWGPPPPRQVGQRPPRSPSTEQTLSRRAWGRRRSAAGHANIKTPGTGITTYFFPPLRFALLQKEMSFFNLSLRDTSARRGGPSAPQSYVGTSAGGGVGAPMGAASSDTQAPGGSHAASPSTMVPELALATPAQLVPHPFQ